MLLTEVTIRQSSCFQLNAILHFFFLVLGTEPRVLWMLGKNSDTELHPQTSLIFI